jgi:general secretion pathway protein D
MKALLALVVLLAPTPARAAAQRAGAPVGQDPVPAQPGAAPQQPAPSSGTGGQSQVPLVQEIGDYLVLNVDETGTESIDLEWLTKVCENYTDNVFTYEPQTGTALQAIHLRLIGPKRVPIKDFYSFYQVMMFIHGFILTRVGPDPISVVLVQPVQPVAGKPTNVRNEAVYVTPEELPAMASQVATQVVTVLHLPHTDVRQLGNSLRGLGADPSGQQSVIPVGNTNSVILNGFASNVASLARILQLVDEESAKDIGVNPEFDVLPLEYAAAEDVADILEQLLEAARRNVQGARQQVAAQGATGQLATQGGESKILTYPRTNSLLVMALPDDMRNIKELVARLDVDVPEPERTYHVYALQNVKAADLAEVLDDFLQGASRVTGGQRGGGQGGAGGGGANPAPSPGLGLSSRDEEIVVVADEATNSLLIAASKRRYEEMLELVRNLDQRQDQVLIETALIELSGQNTLDLGVELGFANVPEDGTGGFGITSFGLSTWEDTTGDGVPDIRLPSTDLLGVTGGVIDAGDFSLPFLLNAVKGRRDTNVLNIPSVLVNNNGSATVTALESQPTQTSTQAAAGGSQTGFGGYQDAGITMQISPSISAAGYLRLDVSLEVSNFTGSFSGGIPPPKTTRTVVTSVNVPDGDTMVIGGIINDNKSEDRTGVPLLSDIPLLGILFRRDSNSLRQTTLYFFVTPHILEDKNFADLAEMSYKIKLRAAEEIGADRVRRIDPDFDSAGEKVDLKPFDLPLYRSPPPGEVNPQDVGLDPVERQKLLDQQKQQQAPPQGGETPPPAVGSPGGGN